MKIFVIADTHFGHKNILTFTNKFGELIRGARFKTIEEHDQALVDNWNSVVAPQDHVYHLGDVAINKHFIKTVSKLSGHKRLVFGNHDIYPISMYQEAGFEKFYGVRVWPKHGIIMSHIPLQHDSLISRNWKNIHGHLHGGIVSGPFHNLYECVSCEHVNYTPKLVME